MWQNCHYRKGCVRERAGSQARGRASSPTQRGNEQIHDNIRAAEARLGSLPKALSAFSNGWVETTKTTPYKVVMKEEYNKLENGISAGGTFKWLHEFSPRLTAKVLI